VSFIKGIFVFMVKIHVMIRGVMTPCILVAALGVFHGNVCVTDLNSWHT
jgi:hypothetical protein